MSEQINPSMIKETQDALAKYIKKPPLTEKLLIKPPFRYLHDIVIAVIKETGFLKGIFTSEELDSNNVKDKESKIAFLSKLISSIKQATGSKISARPAKIVAGLEVSKTLELLQLIGKAIDDKVGANTNLDKQSDSAVVIQPPNVENIHTKVKKKEAVSNEISKESKRGARKSDATQPSNVKRTTEKEDGSNKKIVRSKSIKLEKEPSPGRAPKVDKKTQKKAVAPEVDSNSKVTTRTAVKRNSISSQSTPVRRTSLRDSKRSVINSAKPVESTIQEEKNETNETMETKEKFAENVAEIERKYSSRISETTTKNENEESLRNHVEENVPKMEKENAELVQEVSKEVEKREKSSLKRRESVSMPRPGSARPGSRKLVYGNDDEQKKIVSENFSKENSEMKANENKNQVPSTIRPRTANRPPSARPGAPRVRDRGEVSTLEEPNSVTVPVNVIEEGKQDQFIDEKDSFIVIEAEKTPLPLDEAIDVNESEQGQLVHQILKTQKELNESVVADDANQNKQPKIEWEAGRKAEKYVISEEIEKIRRSIQALTSAANPLGKLFDFLQEDVDEMQRELQHWKSANEKLHKQQTSELELGKTLLQPLQKQLLDIENGIEEEYLQIANLKMSILNNDEKILKLAANIIPKARIK